MYLPVVVKQANKLRRTRGVLLLGLALLILSACNNNAAVPPVSDLPLVEVNLTFTGTSLEGENHVELLRKAVQVRNQGDNIVQFDEQNVANSRGERLELAVPADETSLTVYLPAGQTYVLFGLAFDSSDNLLAASTAERTTTGGGSNATVMKFKALLGAAQLLTRLPTRQLMPGQEIDLLLSVTPSERPDLNVTPTDYRASYETSNATSLSFSELGIRVRAGDRVAGDVVVTSTAAGLQLLDDEAVSGAVSVALRLPFSTGLGVDLDPPELSKLAFDAEQQIFTGVADDDHSIVKLELYDGPVMLASSDPQAMDEKNVPEVIFPGGGTAFYTRISLPAGYYILTVVASDFSGNDTHAKHEVSVP